ADQATCRDQVIQTNTAFAVRDHVFDIALTLAHCLHHKTLVLFFDIQRYVLERLLHTAIDHTVDNFRTGHSQFEAFTTHVFDKNGQVQLTTTGYTERVRIFSFFNTQCHVVHQLFVQAVKNLTRGNIFTFFATERRGVDVEEHGDCWFINRQRWQRFDILRIAKGVGDVQFAQTGDRDDIARFSFGGFNTLQTEVSQNFTHFTVTCFTFAVDQSDLLVR